MLTWYFETTGILGLVNLPSCISKGWEAPSKLHMARGIPGSPLPSTGGRGGGNPGNNKQNRSEMLYFYIKGKHGPVLKNVNFT